jgi:hypothetical protein
VQVDLDFPIVSVLANFTQGPPNGLGNPVPLDVGDGRGIETVSVTRGRPYELGTVQAGTCSIVVDDPSETLNPANPSSPFMTGGKQLALYRGVGVRAWWPRVGNLIQPATYAEIIHPGFETGGTNGWVSVGGVIDHFTGTPWQGVGCARLTLDGPSATASPRGGAGWLHIAGRVHTYSVWVRRSSGTPGVSITLTVAGVTSAAATSTTWTRLSVTYLAASALEVPVLTVTGGAAGDGTQVIYVDGEQLELAAAATTWRADGPIRYQMFTGYIERYPQQWINAGRRGVRPLEAVDALAPMSRTIITSSYEQEITSDNPSLWLPLDDAAGPGRVAGALAGSVQLAEFVSPRGGAISWGGATMPDGSRAVALSQQLQDPADTLLANQFTEIDTRSPVGPSPSEFSLDSRGATVEFWARVDASITKIAFQAVPSRNFHAQLGSSGDTVIGLTFFADGSHRLVVSTPAGYDALDATAAGQAGFLNDGQWHYFAIVLWPTPATPTQYSVWARADARTSGRATGRTHRQVGINSVQASAFTVFGDPLSKVSVAQMAFYNKILPDARLEAHYLHGIGRAGELASARAARLLTTYWGGGYVVRPGSGLTLPADHSYSGSSVLAALEDITSTDEGLLYVNGGGQPVVESRLTRHGQTGPAFTFGEDSAAGEFPYTAINYDYDPQYVYSQVSLTRPGRSEPLVLVDPAVEAIVGQRVFSKQLSVETDYELEQAALYYRHRYGLARLRIKSLTLDPASQPALWPVVLGLELSTRVRVRRRTATGAVMDGEYYVESIKHDASISGPSWKTTLELSPVFVPQVWVLGDAQRGVLGATTTPIY